MTVDAGTINSPARLTLRFSGGDVAGLRWAVQLEPELRLAVPAALTLGRSIAQVQLRVESTAESDGVLLACTLDVRTLARIWHMLNVEHATDIHVTLVSNESQHIDAVLDSDGLRLLLEETEGSANLGPRTRTLSPPIYLRSFWGFPPRGRMYGMLDLMLARLQQMTCVPKELLAKARRLEAPNNWGIVCQRELPHREEILDALTPLLEHRRGRVLELPHGDSQAAIEPFLVDFSRLPIEERPYYLLLLGDFDAVSMEMQYFLQSFAAVGRLALDSPDAYATYAAKVVSHEATLGSAGEVSLAYVAADRDEVNSRNLEDLVEPLAKAEELPRPKLVLAYGRATKGRVLQALGHIEERAVAFISAHGFEHVEAGGLPIELVLEDQLAFQGSIVLDDFFGSRPLGSTEGLLTAEDVSSTPFAPGGIVLLHACYSGGTVGRDTMPEWVNLPMPGRLPPSRPFVSRLGRALLSNPRGPVALYAHVNRSHQYDYFVPAHPEQTLTYRQYNGMLRALADGQPIGLGREVARSMTIQYMYQALTISHEIEILLTGTCTHPGGVSIMSMTSDLSVFERGFLQYSFATCNFRNYVILGDPLCRVRLPPPEVRNARLQ